MCHRMLTDFGESLSDLAPSDEEGHGAAEDHKDIKLGKLHKNDKPCLVMGTIPKTVLQRMERFGQKQTKFD